MSKTRQFKKGKGVGTLPVPSDPHDKVLKTRRGISRIQAKAEKAGSKKETTKLERYKNALELLKVELKSAKSLRRRQSKKKVHKPTQGLHNNLTHNPMDPECDVCRRCKPARAQCRSGTIKADALPPAKEFADRITADHAIFSAEDKSKEGDKVSLVIQDRFTHWLQSYPCKTKSAEETRMKMIHPIGQKPMGWRSEPCDA